MPACPLLVQEDAADAAVDEQYASEQEQLLHLTPVVQQECARLVQLTKSPSKIIETLDELNTMLFKINPTEPTALQLCPTIEYGVAKAKQGHIADAERCLAHRALLSEPIDEPLTEHEMAYRRREWR